MTLEHLSCQRKLCVMADYGLQSTPEALGCIDLIHGHLDLVVRLNVSDERLNDLVAEAPHALCQLLFHIVSNLLLGLFEKERALQIAG